MMEVHEKNTLGGGSVRTYADQLSQYMPIYTGVIQEKATRTGKTDNIYTRCHFIGIVNATF